MTIFWPLLKFWGGAACSMRSLERKWLKAAAAASFLTGSQEGSWPWLRTYRRMSWSLWMLEGPGEDWDLAARHLEIWCTQGFQVEKKNFSRRRRRCRWRQQLVIKNINAKEFNAKSLTSFPRQQQTTQEKLMDLEMDLNVMLRFIATCYFIPPICCWKGVVLENFKMCVNGPFHLAFYGIHLDVYIIIALISKWTSG